MTTLTPMMRQYQEIKAQYKDCILFFRLGDFYEMFAQDAEKGAKLLEIVLTHRNGTPMCGIPHHAVDQYLSKLTQVGEKVAICEQVSDPTLPGIVKREVVRVITPGTTFSENLLDTKTNQYTLALFPSQGRFGLAVIDITTGTFLATELTGYDQLAAELQRLTPRECILPTQTHDPNLVTLFEAFPDCYTYRYQTTQNAHSTLQNQFPKLPIDAMGIHEWPLAIEAAGLLLNHLKETQKSDLTHLKVIKPYRPDQHMLLDEATLRNLELLGTLRDQNKEGSLLGVLDDTLTAMGGRLLKQWILRPLTDRRRIESRLEAVDAFYNTPHVHDALREEINSILDLERVASRLALDRGTPRDLVALKVSLQQIPPIKQQLESLETPALKQLNRNLEALPHLIDLIQRAIVDEPSLNLKEGGFIREGFDPDLDELRTISSQGKGFIKTLQQQEVKRTGIQSLKIKYNSVFGYYIEISKANLDRAPDDYIRKQTLVNAERFITPELKEYEEKVLSADEKSKALECELFKKVREIVMQELRIIQQNAEAIANLDVLLTLAHVAKKNRYTKPEIGENGPLEIQKGRHPVVETMNPAGDFVPNDTALNDSDQQIILLTGPNMSGKSTLLRQVALITLMAQMGSFVPATSAKIVLVDRIFTRVGASDNLARGQSTFMVEMQETANILNNATSKSLIILDEIGRGTSTYDGMSIAWAILDHLHDHIGAKTLFATHYHELIAVAERLEKAQNYCVAVKEEMGKGVVFLHKILKGGIDKSYGIEVAKLAGLPANVIEKARHILKDLEADAEMYNRSASPTASVGEEGVLEKGIQEELGNAEQKTTMSQCRDRSRPVPQESDRAHQALDHPLVERLKQVDVDQLTPMQALQMLGEMKDHAIFGLK